MNPSAKDQVTPPPPGALTAVPVALEEPTQPHGPLPPKPEQQSPDTVSPTGAALETDPLAMSQQGAFLTTATGARLRDTDHSLRAGPRGPTLLQDHHLREKITHFDHERIPERVVHARGTGAHGIFVGYGSASDLTSAAFLEKDVETPVFVRFSTVLGSRGSADTVRDTRGFATKFYTTEGNFDLVGNNIPVFFVQDGIKFPDIVHAAKPHPDREIPQAQSAHDTFWDFVSLHTEAQHHTLWNMSDRAIPRSYRHMEGFGVHTFRLVNGAGGTTLVKFHWKPRLGVHSLVWEEAQLLNGTDPDFHRRDLYDAIEAGAHPQWELGIQAFPDTPEQTFEGIDLLDPTKFVPEELAPVHPLGLLTLSGTPTNFFAESEQVAFLDVPQAVAAGAKVRELSASFDDHFSQARLFWLSMSPVEQDHIVQAYTFELGKCYDDTIRRRQLLALARIDGELAADVAGGLGMPVPDPAVDVEDVTPSPALSQVGGTWPVEGRTVAVVVDPTSDADAVMALTEQLRAERLVPLLLAPTGGPVWADRALAAHRTLLTARSVEFDAVVVAALVPPAADAGQSREGTASPGGTTAVDPRLTLLVDEAFRHGKAIGVIGDTHLAAALGLADDEAGITVGNAAAVGTAVVEGLAAHRAWNRFTPTR